MKNVIVEAWCNNTNLGGERLFWMRLKEMTIALSKRNNEVFGFCQSRIAELEDQLGTIQLQMPTEDNLALESSIQAQFNEWQERLKLIRKQKS